MFKDKISMNRQTDSEKMTMGLQSKDPLNVRMVGDCTDRIFKNGVLVEERVGHNLVVNSFLNIVMSLLKEESGYRGITYWAVGQGSNSWDNDMVDPTLTETSLTSEIGRVAILPSDIAFLDSEGNISNTPTNILQIRHTFGSSDCNGVWREFAIFGGNATSVANTGIMINKRHHAILTKTDEMTVERTMRFTLSLT